MSLVEEGDPRRCTAHAKDCSGRQCGNYSMVGSNVCESHGALGALSNIGPANVGYVDGRASKYKFRGLDQRFKDAVSDTTLLEQRQELVIFNTLVQDALDRLDSGDPGSRWTRLRDYLKKFQASRRAANVPGAPKIHTQTAAEALGMIEQLIEEGAEQVVLRKELRETLIDQDKLIRSERKRLQELGQIVTVEDMMSFFQEVMVAINEEVRDQSDRVALNNRLIGMAKGRRR